MQPLSVYVHIPFCQRKCHYCDFNTYAGVEHLMPAYLDALEAEVQRWGPLAQDWDVTTVFLGGGTPSLLTGDEMLRLLDACRRAFRMAPDAEVTIEANPGTVDATKLGAYVAAGVNRISFGAQSFQSDELQWLGRIHGRAEIGAAVRLARSAGVQRLNLDLIYGLPGQSLASWRANVRAALALAPEHLSLYALTVEEGTPLADWVARGRAAEPDPDVAAEHYGAAEELLSAAGYANYEISNWARPGEECRHNITYWQNRPYLGLGAGAHGRFADCRYSNVLLPQAYIERMAQKGEPAGAAEGRTGIESASPTAEVNQVLPEDDLMDTLVLGLRLGEGVRFADVMRQHGVDVQQRFGPALEECVRLRLLEVDDAGMRLTPQARLIANEVFVRLMSVPEPVG